MGEAAGRGGPLLSGGGGPPPAGRPSAASSSAWRCSAYRQHWRRPSGHSGGPWTSTRRPSSASPTSPSPCRIWAGTTRPSSISSGRRDFNPNEAGLHALLGHSAGGPGAGTPRPSPSSDRPSRSTRTTRPPGTGLRAILVRLGRGRRRGSPGGAALEADPPEHDAWYGYAEFCLFLGQEDEYRRARQDVLASSARRTDPHVAERHRPGLPAPARGGGRAAPGRWPSPAGRGRRPSKYQGLYPRFLFARGLAEYRQGRLDRAIASMRGDAARMPGPAPRLVLAMALHRSGRSAEARRRSRRPSCPTTGGRIGYAIRMSLDPPRAPPRGRGPDPPGPAGLPGRETRAPRRRRAIGPARRLPVHEPHRRRRPPLLRSLRRAPAPGGGPPPPATATAPPARRPWPAPAAARTRRGSMRRSAGDGAIRLGVGCARTLRPGTRRP